MSIAFMSFGVYHTVNTVTHYTHKKVVIATIIFVLSVDHSDKVKAIMMIMCQSRKQHLVTQTALPDEKHIFKMFCWSPFPICAFVGAVLYFWTEYRLNPVQMSVIICNRQNQPTNLARCTLDRLAVGCH